MLIVTEHIVQVLKTAMTADKTAMSAGKYGLSVGKTGMSVLCDSSCIVICRYFTGKIRSCISNCRICVLYYWSSIVQNRSYTGKNSSCVVMNSTSDLCDGSSNPNYRTSVLMNSELFFISDTVIEPVSSIPVLFECHLNTIEKLCQRAVSFIRFQHALTKNFLYYNILILQNTMYELCKGFKKYRSKSCPKILSVQFIHLHQQFFLTL